MPGGRSGEDSACRGLTHHYPLQQESCALSDGGRGFAVVRYIILSDVLDETRGLKILIGAAWRECVITELPPKALSHITHPPRG